MTKYDSYKAVHFDIQITQTDGQTVLKHVPSGEVLKVTRVESFSSNNPKGLHMHADKLIGILEEKGLILVQSMGERTHCSICLAQVTKVYNVLEGHNTCEICTEVQPLRTMLLYSKDSESRQLAKSIAHLGNYFLKEIRRAYNVGESPEGSGPAAKEG